MINHEIMSSYVYDKGEKYGWIRLVQVNAKYRVELHILGVSGPVDIRDCVDYYNALNVYTIFNNKYNH